MSALHELPGKWRTDASRLSTYDGVAIGKRACADELEAALKQAGEPVAWRVANHPNGPFALRKTEPAGWAVIEPLHTAPPADTAARLDDKTADRLRRKYAKARKALGAG